MIDGGAGADVIRGGGGNNTVSYQSSAGRVKVDLSTGITQYGDAAGDRLYNIQNITGSLKNDILIGDNQDNELNGVLGKDRLIGNGGHDTFIMLGAGPVVIDGGTGNDLMQFISAVPGTYGYAFSAACKVEGGTGYDTVELTNIASVTLKATTLVNVERIAVMDGFDYDLKTVDANVASGKLLEVDAGTLGAAYKIDFDGSAETDGRFQFDGGAGADIFKAGAGADVLTGLGGADNLTGGGGADTFVFTDVTDSEFSARDRIMDFKAGTDELQFDFKVTGIDAAVGGGVSADGDLVALLAGHLEAHHAILVDVSSGALAGHKLLVVDGDGVDGFTAADDYVIDVKGISGNLKVTDFIV
jgi:Ca2+-binding RTX toxin-like protein